MSQVSFDEFGNPFIRGPGGVRYPVQGARGEELKRMRRQQIEAQRKAEEEARNRQKHRTPHDQAREKIKQAREEYGQRLRELEFQKSQMSPQE